MDKNEQTEWKMEGFPEPRTFPNAWDGFALMSTNGHYHEEGEELLRNKDDVRVDWHPEKFPKPRTYPNNWSIDD